MRSGEGVVVNWYLAVLKNYAGFGGRARRKEYWMFTLFNSIFIAALIAIDLAIGTNIPYLVYALAVLVPALAVGFRRLHDTGRSAWWFFIALIPLVGSIVLLVFFASDSAAGENKYGPNPKLADARA
jgi:uncharacterized membrane protein YhaH (DUF805 family)